MDYYHLFLNNLHIYLHNFYLEGYHDNIEFYMYHNSYLRYHRLFHFLVNMFDNDYDIFLLLHMGFYLDQYFRNILNSLDWFYLHKLVQVHILIYLRNILNYLFYFYNLYIFYYLHLLLNIDHMLVDMLRIHYLMCHIGHNNQIYMLDILYYLNRDMFHMEFHMMNHQHN